MVELVEGRASGPGALVPGDFGWHLGMVLQGYHALFERAVDGMPAGIRGFQVLSAVAHKAPPNQQALGAHLSIDRTVLTYLLDELVEAGLVERVPGKHDRRVRTVLPTLKGHRVLAQYEERVAKAESELLHGLGDKGSEELRTLIGQVSRHVHNADPGANPCEAMDLLA
jgi:DNA-binding MarR family transcriptional regulator